MANLILLKPEVMTDPDVRGYSGMNSQEVAADLNDKTQASRNRTIMTGAQSVDSQAAWDALTDQKRLEFLALCGRDSIDPFGVANVALVTSAFGGGTATVLNLQAARVESLVLQT